MTAEPKDSMQREQGVLPVDGLAGSIMNPTVLKKMGGVITETINENPKFSVFKLNTSSKTYAGNVKKTCEAVVKRILSWVEESTQENILSAPRKVFDGLENSFALDAESAARIINTFAERGTFRPRKRVESDDSSIQPLPVVVVRNKSGHVLQLVRKERDKRNPLHKKVAVWAGGHVRREDAEGGNSILNGAVRELQEELRLYIEPESLNLLGAVYEPSGEKTRKHMAIVYEWNAPNDDVEVTLCRSEFFEKGGTSLTGSFVPPERLSPADEGLEEWSSAILSSLLRHVPRSSSV